MVAGVELGPRGALAGVRDEATAAQRFLRHRHAEHRLEHEQRQHAVEPCRTRARSPAAMRGEHRDVQVGEFARRHRADGAAREFVDEVAAARAAEHAAQRRRRPRQRLRDPRARRHRLFLDVRDLGHRARDGEHDVDGQAAAHRRRRVLQHDRHAAAAAATRRKNAVAPAGSAIAFGAITMIAAACCSCAWRATASVVAGSAAVPPTTNATRPCASAATMSDRRVRSAAVSVSYSLATPGYTTPSAPAPIAYRAIARRPASSGDPSGRNGVASTG